MKLKDDAMLDNDIQVAYKHGYEDGYNDALKEAKHTVNRWREIAEQLRDDKSELIVALNEARVRRL